MERKVFLKNGVTALGLAVVAPLFKVCTKDGVIATTSTSAADSTGMVSGVGSCTVTPTETAGPFPTHTPSCLVSANIVSDRTGVPLTIKITINNSKNGCAALSGAIVDIRHCPRQNKIGSEPKDYTSLRGAPSWQIVPAWYC